MKFSYYKKTLFNLVFIFALDFALTTNSRFRTNYINNTYTVFHWISGKRDQFVNYRNVEFGWEGWEDSRIIGGQFADVKDYPFMAYLAKAAGLVWGDFRGGAAIISSYWALTAAHCMLYISEQEIENRHAFVRGNTSFWKENYTEHIIIKSIVHEQYHQQTTDYDIAILKVETAFDGKYEKPIAFVRSNYKYNIGSTVTALGWGSTDENVINVSDELNYVHINLVEHGECFYVFGGVNAAKPITDRMVCAIAPGKDACIYDSGGPLIQSGKLIGIVSWGPSPCASPIRPGVYTKLSCFSFWIRKKMRYH